MAFVSLVTSIDGYSIPLPSVEFLSLPANVGLATSVFDPATRFTESGYTHKTHLTN